MKKFSKGAQFIIDCRDPFFFCEAMWGLTPQPPKPECEDLIAELPPEEWKAEHFGESEKVELGEGRYYFKWKWYDGNGGWVESRDEFIRRKWITWQQTAMMTADKNHVENMSDPIALQQFIGNTSTASGHGIGKSARLSWKILWFLFAFPYAQVAATAPTKQQIFDILWKELSVWIARMPAMYAELYEWQSSHIRMKSDPEIWFARAATARKENPEALAGVHGEHVLLVADEASGVEEVIFQTAEGAMTGGHVMFEMISNPTRNTGYFKNSHKKDRNDFINFQFSSEESPVVDVDYVIKMATKYDRTEDNFMVRVSGLFPNEEAMDDSGYMPLFNEAEIEAAQVPDSVIFKAEKLGVDPAGTGGDKAAWVGANAMLMKILAEEKVSTPVSGATKTLTLATEHDLPGEMIEMDSFGEGARWLSPINAAGKIVKGFNPGDASNSKEFMDKRAEGAWKFRLFIKAGGQLVKDKRWKELLEIRYRRNVRGKIQIMSKKDMKKLRIPSPNFFDAACYCFLGTSPSVVSTRESNDDEMRRLEELVRKQQMTRYG